MRSRITTSATRHEVYLKAPFIRPLVVASTSHSSYLERKLDYCSRTTTRKESIPEICKWDDEKAHRHVKRVEEIVDNLQPQHNPPDSLRVRPILLETCSIIGSTGHQGNVDREKADSCEERRQSKDAYEGHKAVAVMAILVDFDLSTVSALVD